MDQATCAVENVGMTFETKKGSFVALRDIDLDGRARASSSR